MKKLIVSDCDNVLCDWEYAFDCYANSHGFYRDPTVKPTFELAPMYRLQNEHCYQLARQFNESAAIGFLPAVRDAYQWVRKLGEEGWRFHVVSSASSDPCVKELRVRNLEKLFGPIFEHVECLPIGASKRAYLEQNFGGSGLFWVEDNPENCDVGIEVGLKGILLKHGYNLEYSGPATMVKNWKSIYSIITQ